MSRKEDKSRQTQRKNTKKINQGQTGNDESKNVIDKQNEGDTILQLKVHHTLKYPDFFPSDLFFSARHTNMSLSRIMESHTSSQAHSPQCKYTYIQTGSTCFHIHTHTMMASQACFAVLQTWSPHAVMCYSWRWATLGGIQIYYKLNLPLSIKHARLEYSTHWI